MHDASKHRFQSLQTYFIDLLNGFRTRFLMKYTGIFSNPFKSEFIIVILTHYKPRIAAAILDL